MGGEVVFGCGAGYELVGTPRLHCLETGNWDNRVPYCRGEQMSVEKMRYVLFLCCDYAYGFSPTVNTRNES